MTDRLKAATEARAAALARFRDRPPADDPAVVARKAERAQIAREREVRVAAREQARIEAEAQRAAEAEAERERLAAEEILAADIDATYQVGLVFLLGQQTGLGAGSPLFGEHENG